MNDQQRSTNELRKCIWSVNHIEIKNSPVVQVHLIKMVVKQTRSELKHFGGKKGRAVRKGALDCQGLSRGTEGKETSWKEIALTVETLKRMKTVKIPLESNRALGLFEERLR